MKQSLEFISTPRVRLKSCLSYTIETASASASGVDADYQHKIAGQWKVSLCLSVTLKVLAFLYSSVGFYLIHCTAPQRAVLRCFSKGLAEGKSHAGQ